MEDYGACAGRAKDELDSGICPELSEHIDADVMAQYDVVYLGFPKMEQGFENVLCA